MVEEDIGTSVEKPLPTAADLIKGETKKFGDIYQPTIEFEGEKVEEKEVVGKDIIIHDFAMLNGQFGEFAIVDATVLLVPASVIVDIKIVDVTEQGKRVQFAEGSEVIMRQLKKIKEDNNFPIMTKIEERVGEKSKMTYRTLS